MKKCSSFCPAFLVICFSCDVSEGVGCSFGGGSWSISQGERNHRTGRARTSGPQTLPDFSRDTWLKNFDELLGWKTLVFFLGNNMIFVGQGWSFRGFSPKLQGTYWDAALESKEWDHWIVFLFFFCERRLELTPFGVWQKDKVFLNRGVSIYIFFFMYDRLQQKIVQKMKTFLVGASF